MNPRVLHRRGPGRAPAPPGSSLPAGVGRRHGLRDETTTLHSVSVHVSRLPALRADRLAVREVGPEEDENLVSDWPLLGTRWIDARAWDLEAVHQLAQPPVRFETCIVECLGERASLLRRQVGGV